ncbi:MAG: biotin--[acetyl-CoA-carboxylase] ligase [Myxococcota bacterium]
MTAPLLRLAEAGSTNDEARRLAAGGAPHGTAVTAARQTAGRGRLGRSWVSAEGAVALSVVVRPAMAPERVPLLTLAAAVAVARCCGEGWAIKWPNDVVGARGEGKVAGILAEADWAGGALAFAVLGIGVNVTDAPPDVGAAALAALGPPPDRDELVDALVQEVVRWVDRLAHDGAAPVLDAWRARSNTLGQQVAVGEVRGTALDVDVDGALLVRDAAGAVHRILAGDVALVADHGR